MSREVVDEEGNHLGWLTPEEDAEQDAVMIEQSLSEGEKPCRVGSRRRPKTTGGRELFTFRIRRDVLGRLREMSEVTGHTVGALIEIALIEDGDWRRGRRLRPAKPVSAIASAPAVQVIQMAPLGDGLVALCNDGGMWRAQFWEGRLTHWIRVPGIKGHGIVP